MRSIHRRHTARQRLGGWGTVVPAVEVRCQCLIGVVKMLRNNADIANDSHVICITFPPWDNMNVQMLSNARASSRPEVQTNIEPIRVQRLLQHLFANHGKFGEFSALTGSEGAQGRGMDMWHDHNVAVVVWIAIHDHKRRVATPEDQMLCIALFLGFVAEDTTDGFLRQDVLHTPRRPDDFTHTLLLSLSHTVFYATCP